MEQKISKTIIKSSSLIFILIMTVITIIFAQKGCDSSNKNKAEVLSIISLPHGLSRISPEDRKIIDRIKKSPYKYLPILEQEVKFNSNLTELLEEEKIRKVENSLSLLSFIDNQKASDIIIDTQDNLIDYLNGEWELYREYSVGKRKSIPPLANNMTTINVSILNNLKLYKNPAAINNAVMLIEYADYSTALTSLQYLVEVAAGDQEVAEKVGEAIRKPTSSFYKDPLGDKFLKVLRTSSESQK